MKRSFAVVIFCLLAPTLFSQDPSAWLATLPQAKDYVQHRASSYDRTGGNADFRTIAAGETLTLLDDAGHLCLVARFFCEAGNWGDIRYLDLTPSGGSNPIYAVIGRSLGTSAGTAD